MTQCAFLLEVVVGELTLTTQSPPASPTLCIKASGGPPLLVPFLAQAFTHTLGQRAAEDGRYIFHRGKSSIFSASSRCLGGGGKGVRVRVEVLSCGGGSTGLPVVLGRCDAEMAPQDETSMRFGLQGKLALSGGSGEAAEAVGHLTLSLSLRNLGEVVPVIRNWGLYEGKARADSAPGPTSTYEESFDIIHDYGDSALHNTPYHDLPASEKIALKLAALQDPSEALQDEWPPSYDLQENDWGNLAQPTPILYSSLDKEGERLWEEKMARMEKSDAAQNEEGQQGGVKIYETKDISDRTKPSTQGDYTSENSNTETTHTPAGTHLGTDGTQHTPKRHHRHKQRGRHTHKHTSRRPHPPPSIVRPQGWLRSTPPAKTSSTPPPRLNRTHILRLAAVNPQLGQGLRAEVERQVKDRMKGLEVEFLERVEKLAARTRTYRVHRQATVTTRSKVESVGCQTEGATYSQVPSVREPSQGTSISSSSSSTEPSQPSGHRQSYTPPKHPATHASPKHPSRPLNKATYTQTDTYRSHTYRSHTTPLHTDRREVTQHSPTGRTGTEAARSSQRATGDLRVPCTRVKLGEMPKNVTYVIGPGGERVYGEGIVLALEGVEGKNMERQEECGEGGEGEGNESRLTGRDGTVGEGGGGQVSEGRPEDRLTEREITEGEGRGGRHENRPAERRGKKHKIRQAGKDRVEPKQNTDDQELSIITTTTTTSKPRPQMAKGQTLGSDLRTKWAAGRDTQPPREPSQETWALTYTIQAADYDHSAASTPPTHLTTPETEDSGGGGEQEESYMCSEVDEEVVDEVSEGEVEEEVEEDVPTASSRSAQVCREIFKGRKADILSGVAMSSPKPQTRSDGRKYQETNIKNEDSSVASDFEGQQDSTPADDRPSGSHREPRESASGSVDSSISDISARIAALLVAKRVSVPRLNTESVSSYVPSEQPGTLSSMSDVIMSPSSSLSG